MAVHSAVFFSSIRPRWHIAALLYHLLKKVLRGIEFE